MIEKQLNYFIPYKNRQPLDSIAIDKIHE